jgi:hypothetical protein
MAGIVIWTKPVSVEFQYSYKISVFFRPDYSFAAGTDIMCHHQVCP